MKMDILSFTMLVVNAVDDHSTLNPPPPYRSVSEYNWTAYTTDGRMYVNVLPTFPSFVGVASVMLDGSEPHYFGDNANV